jgi:hypothetical protein
VDAVHDSPWFVPKIGQVEVYRGHVTTKSRDLQRGRASSTLDRAATAAAAAFNGPVRPSAGRSPRAARHLLESPAAAIDPVEPPPQTLCRGRANTISPRKR